MLETYGDRPLAEAVKTLWLSCEEQVRDWEGGGVGGGDQWML